MCTSATFAQVVQDSASEALILEKETLREQVLSERSEKEKVHSPRKATILSAVVPGLGQVYNRKYWKAGLLYAGLATSIYFIIDNNDKYKTYKNAYTSRVDGDSTTTDAFVGIYTDNNLLTLQNFYRRNRDLSWIITVGLYIINIVDANIDAHLFEFDVSDELTLNVQPRAMNIPGTGKNSLGLQLYLRF